MKINQLVYHLLFSALWCSAVYGYNVYDSRDQVGPHQFDWNSVYDRVEIYEEESFTISGGFIEYFKATDDTVGSVNYGFIDYLNARDRAIIDVFHVESGYIAAREESIMKIYSASQPSYGQIQASDNGVMRLFGGSFGRVYTWPNGGRIELLEGNIWNSFTIHSSGVGFQRGGAIDEVSVTSNGIAVLDEGSVSGVAFVNGSGTLILSGAQPPEEIRLFDSGCVLILHDDTRYPSRLTYSATDFTEPHRTGFMKKTFSIHGDSGYKEVFLTAATSELGSEWNGVVELVYIDSDLIAIPLANSQKLVISMKASSDYVHIFEESIDLVSWTSLGVPIVGDWKIHTEILGHSGSSKAFGRVRKWLKPTN